MSNLIELEQDLKELETLLATASRKRTKDILETEIKNVKGQIDIEKKSAPQPVKITEAVKIESKGEAFQNLTKYAWNQEKKVVKIYISLENVASADVKLDTGKDFIDVKVRNYKGGNCRFQTKTFASIDVAKSKVVVKPNDVVITIYKDADEWWDSLGPKKSKSEFKEDEKPKNLEDPLMDMMKKLYNEGDPEMKKTIEKAWSNTHDKFSQPGEKF